MRSIILYILEIVVIYMAEIKSFTFISNSKVEDDINNIQFDAKGYVDDKTIYFKNGADSYKFILDESLKVFFNESQYEFDLNKKTLAFINSEGFTFNASVITNRLDILTNKIVIEYIMDFVSFKGEYSIIVEWH